MAELLHVQVCYARPDRCWLRDLTVADGCTLNEAIVQSGILDEAPEIDLSGWRVGVYGKLKPLDTVLRERDRVEIYRPLQADPKESRRRRADTRKTGASGPVR
jgi:uncharacterized protein